MYEEFINYNNVPVRVLGADVPAISNDSPYIKKRKLRCNLHFHNEYEISRVNRGSICYLIQNEEFILNEGDILFVNKYIPHCTYSEDNYAHQSLIQFKPMLDNDSISQYVERFAGLSDMHAYVFKKNAPETVRIKKYINTIINEFSCHKPFWGEYVYHYVQILLAELHRQGILYAQTHNIVKKIDKILPILEYIDINYNKQISTIDLSRIINFNETYFCRIFKNIIGTSALNYINFIRVLKAKKMLEEKCDISDIAFDVGFSSVSYFDKVFKKYNMCSPSEYRKMINTFECNYKDAW